MPRLSSEDRAGITGGRGQPLLQPSARACPSWTARRRPASLWCRSQCRKAPALARPSVQEGNEGLSASRGVVKSVSPRPKEVPMVARFNRQTLLKSRPEGVPNLDNFVLKQGSVPEPGDGAPRRSAGRYRQCGAVPRHDVLRERLDRARRRRRLQDRFPRTRCPGEVPLASRLAPGAIPAISSRRRGP
jgi:hypothetical protein